MTTSVRNIDRLKSDRAITVQNQMRRDMLRLRAGQVFHASASSAVITPNATDPATTVALANALKAAYNTHGASVVHATTGQGAHLAADVTNVVAVVNATDQTTANTLLNDIKAKYAAHIALLTSHPVADAVNTVAAPVATDAPTSMALANELKVDLNAHFAASFGADATLLVAP